VVGERERGKQGWGGGEDMSLACLPRSPHTTKQAPRLSSCPKRNPPPRLRGIHAMRCVLLH
jgi:hypothetical protein